MSRKCWDSSAVPFGPHQNSLTYPHLQMSERPAAKWITAVARMIPSEIREAEAKVSRRITMPNNCMGNVLWEPIPALGIAACGSRRGSLLSRLRALASTRTSWYALIEADKGSAHLSANRQPPREATIAGASQHRASSASRPTKLSKLPILMITGQIAAAVSEVRWTARQCASAGPVLRKLYNRQRGGRYSAERKEWKRREIAKPSRMAGVSSDLRSRW